MFHKRVLIRDHLCRFSLLQPSHCFFPLSVSPCDIYFYKNLGVSSFLSWPSGALCSLRWVCLLHFSSFGVWGPFCRVMFQFGLLVSSSLFGLFKKVLFFSRRLLIHPIVFFHLILSHIVKTCCRSLISTPTHSRPCRLPPIEIHLTGFFKCNNVISFSSLDSSNGIGGLLHDSTNSILIGFAKAMPATCATHAKFLAVKEAFFLTKTPPHITFNSFFFRVIVPMLLSGFAFCLGLIGPSNLSLLTFSFFFLHILHIFLE